MARQRTVLVTGSSGTVGTALLEALLERGHEAVGADVEPNRWSEAVDERTVQVDLREPDALALLPTDVDLVVHLAANARVRALVETPRKARDNFETTFNVLEHVRQNGIPRFIFSSSREVYGNGGTTRRREEQVAIDSCESPYTAGKMGGEAMVEAYARCYDVEACILRFSNVYGRYDASDRVIPRFIARAVAGRDLPVYGRNKILDFTYLDDCVDGIVRAVEGFEKASGMRFNVASGEGTSLLELAETIAERIPTASGVRVDGNRPGEVNRFVADISKARSVLGYEPTNSPLDGLEETIRWYREHDDVLAEIEPPPPGSTFVEELPISAGSPDVT